MTITTDRAEELATRLLAEKNGMSHVAGNTIRALAKQRDELLAVLIKAREDINWMLNSQKFLNSFVFDYMDAAIASVEGGVA